MSKQSAQEARQRHVEAVATRNKLMKEYADKRDPIHYYTYQEIVKIRKWVVFFGVLLIISLVLWFFVTVIGWAEI